VRHRHPYGRDEKTFREAITEGDRAAASLAWTLRWLGLSVVKPSLIIRPTERERRDYDDGGVDLLVSGRPVQVKRRSQRFFQPEDFPFKEVIYDSLTGFRKLDRKPAAYLLLDQTWLGCLAIPAAAYPGSVIVERTDPTRSHYVREFIALPKEHCLSLESFVSLAHCWARQSITQGA
jgi:hypothetical protein